MQKFETSIQRIAISRPDGGVSLMSFVLSGRGHILPDGARWVDKQRGIWARRAEPAVVAAEIERTVPGATAWQFVLDEDVPTERTFRNALVLVGGALQHDVQRAKEVVLAEVRHARAQKLAALDVEFTKAAGAAMLTDDFTEARRVENERQKLRDLPAVVAGQMVDITDIEALKQFLPG